MAINGRIEESVQQAIDDLGVPGAEVLPIAVDQGTAEGCSETMARLHDVDNLDIYAAAGFFDETDAARDRLFEVNVMSGVRLARHDLKGMFARGVGRVVFVSSESAISPAPEMAHYSATNSKQLGLSRALAELTQGTEVTVHAVLHGPTRTARVEKFIQDVFLDLPREEAERRFMSENRPRFSIGRRIRPEEIGNIVCFLCSTRAAVVNGSCLRAEGGLVWSAF